MKELFQRNTKLQNIKVCQDGDELVIFHTDNKYSKVGKTIAYRLPAKYIYCLQYYEMPFYILKEVKRLLQIEKDSNIPPTVNTDTKLESCVIADSVGVVDSVGEALCPCGFDGCDNDCNYDKEATAIGRVDKICKDCGYPDDYCICDICADCCVITKLVGGHTQCPRCYDFSRQPLFKTYSKTKTDDPANYRHEVRYAPIDDDFDDMPF